MGSGTLHLSPDFRHSADFLFWDKNDEIAEKPLIALFIYHLTTIRMTPLIVFVEVDDK